MRKSRCGEEPRIRILSAARLGVIVLAVVASGCAANQQPSYVQGPQTQVATPQSAAHSRKVEVEDDGKPAQVPGRRMRAEEDDPSQPWSPNYGRGMVEPAPAPTDRRLPKPVDAALARPTPMRTALADAAADNVIARAISAHEMRQH